jgi:hypothetical protein
MGKIGGAKFAHGRERGEVTSRVPFPTTALLAARTPEIPRLGQHAQSAGCSNLSQGEKHDSKIREKIYQSIGISSIASFALLADNCAGLKRYDQVISFQGLTDHLRRKDGRDEHFRMWTWIY